MKDFLENRFSHTQERPLSTLASEHNHCTCEYVHRKVGWLMTKFPCKIYRRTLLNTAIRPMHFFMHTLSIRSWK